MVAEEAEQWWPRDEGGVADRRHDAHPGRSPARFVRGGAHPDGEAETGADPPDGRPDEGEGGTAEDDEDAAGHRSDEQHPEHG